MANMYIKESAIRQYVRSLIREAIEAEAASDPADLEEREKMLAGKPYDRSKFPNGGKSIALERQRRAELGLPPIRKPKGGVVPSLIDANGNDITPENSPEAIQARLNGRVADHREKMAKRFIKKSDRERMAQRLGLSDEEAKNLKFDSYANNVDADSFTQRMLAMSPVERAEEAEKIRRNEIERGMTKNADFLKRTNGLSRRGVSYPTKEELEQRVLDLKAKQAALGPHCDANDYKWKNYDYIIKDTQRIINKYYNNKDVAPSSDAADDIVKDALNDIDNDNRFSEDGALEMGDKYVDPSAFTANSGLQSSKEDDYEPLDSYDHQKRKKGKRDKFDDMSDMGFFDDDDNSFMF